jgi:hypothetical protein
MLLHIPLVVVTTRGPVGVTLQPRTHGLPRISVHTGHRLVGDLKFIVVLLILDNAQHPNGNQQYILY